MSIEKVLFDTYKNQNVYSWILKNKSGIELEVIEFGAAFRRLLVPDRNGVFADIINGYDTLDGYIAADGYQGATVGRYCNRIKDGKFTLNGVEYILAKNDGGKNHLHGGNEGFNKKIWKCTPKENADSVSLVCETVSQDGEEGYPGKMDIRVTFTLTDKNNLSLHYEAVCDRDTVCSLTNHTYYNLGGYAGEDIGKSHYIKVNADKVTEVDGELMPTGRLTDVTGTKFDLRTETPLKEEYDDNFALRWNGLVTEAAVAYEKNSGRAVRVSTNMPGLQLYTANMMDGEHLFKGGKKQIPHTAFCMETQFFPDSPNYPQFPDSTLRANKKYDFETVFEYFTV